MTKNEESFIKTFSFFFSCSKCIMRMNYVYKQKKSFSAFFKQNKNFENFTFFNGKQAFYKSYLVLTKNEESFKNFFYFFFSCAKCIIRWITLISKKKVFQHFLNRKKILWNFTFLHGKQTFFLNLIKFWLKMKNLS